MIESPAIPALPHGVILMTLENGLTIIVREDHSAPVVSAQAWAMTGSIHEGRWLGAGLSHVLEHMLFKGTTTRPGSRIDQEVQEAGGHMNAYTSFDRTVYYVDVPNTGTRVAVDILCDIMQHATLPDEDLAKELDVIRREMDMGQDDPGRRSGRRLFEVAYTRSPYRHTVIGYLDIFNELKPDDIRSYYRERYAPNNTFFVVVGDVNASDIITQIREAYAANKAKPLPPMVLPPEPRQTAPREVIEEAPIELGHFHMAWHIPDLRHADIPALDVLAVLLGSGRSSRLYQNVREKLGVAHSADAWTYNPGNPGLFGMSGLVDADKFAAAQQAMIAEVDKMRTVPVPAAELAKAVKQFISATLASRKTMSGQASDLGGNWLGANDLNFSERYLAAVKRVTPADLQRVAEHYLTAENCSTYALLPKGATPAKAAATETASDRPIQKITLPNGLRLLIKENHRLPFVELQAVFQGGVLAETPGDNGITQLMGKLLLKGTGRRSAEQIATEIESVGGHIDSYAANNSFGVSAEVLNTDFALGLDLLADVMLNPTFPVEALEREREVQLASIADRRDHLLRSAGLLMRQTLFGGTGYGLDGLGTEASLNALTVEQLRAFHAQFTVPNNCILAIFGAVNADEVRAAVEKAFATWHGAPNSARPNLKQQADAEIGVPRRVTETRDKKQAVLVVGFKGATFFDKDRYPLELIQEACSDLGSRLFMRVREKLGLAYYVGAQNMAGLIPGYFAFYCGTAPESAEQVEAELLKEAELLCQDGLTEEELKRAKAKMLGHRKIARQELGALAHSTALDELYGLGFDNAAAEDAKIEAVTLNDILAAARKHLQQSNSVVSVILPDGRQSTAL
jgi:zinc protease